MVHAVVIYVVGAVFVGTLIRSWLGFGEALVAVPLLALRIPIGLAAPVAVLVSITVAAVVVVRDRRDIHARSAGWLVLATLAGIPIGLHLLTRIDSRLVKGGLALVILAFAGYSLLDRSPWRLRSDRLSWLLGCGFVAGILGGAYGMNGPPLVVYGSLRQWSPARFRATLQAYFLPASALGMAGYWLAGLWVPLVTRYYLWSLPAVLLAIPLGRMLNRRVETRGFFRWVYGGLLVIGVVLLGQSLNARLG